MALREKLLQLSYSPNDFAQDKIVLISLNKLATGTNPVGAAHRGHRKVHEWYSSEMGTTSPTRNRGSQRVIEGLQRQLEMARLRQMDLIIPHDDSEVLN